MSRVCTACRHPDRELLDRTLVEGHLTIRDIASRFGLSRTATARHLDLHIARALAQAQARKEATHEESLDDLVHELDADARRIQAAAEKEADYRTAIIAVKERRGLIELRARARGLLRTPTSNPQGPLVTVNTAGPVDHAEALRQAKLLVQFAEDEERDRALAAAQTPALVGGPS